MGFKATDSCLQKVKDDEPIFVLRAQDNSAHLFVRSWAQWNKDTIGEAKFQEALEVAKKMEAWPNRKSPD